MYVIIYARIYIVHYEFTGLCMYNSDHPLQVGHVYSFFLNTKRGWVNFQEFIFSMDGWGSEDRPLPGPLEDEIYLIEPRRYQFSFIQDFESPFAGLPSFAHL